MKKMSEEQRLRAELRKLKEDLADAQVDLALERSFLDIACEQTGQSVEAIKKKHYDQRRKGR